MNQPLTSPRELSVLHLSYEIDETCPVYNEHSLPMAEQRTISICTFNPTTAVQPPAAIKLFDGDGTLRGFINAMTAALKFQTYDIIHIHAVHFGLLLPVLHWRYHKALQPRVYTFHSSYPNYKRRNKLLLLWMCVYASKIICCGQASAQSLPAVYRRIAGKRLGCIANGLDITRVDKQRQQRSAGCAANKPFTVLSVGRIVAIKNPLTLLRAFQHYTDNNPGASRLIFIGEGILSAELATQKDQLGLGERVQLPGLISRDEVFQQLADADLFVSSSRGEGLPIATLEAMACGCPVVLSDIPPHREIAAEVNFIPLFDPDDEAGLAQILHRFQSMPATERRAIGQQCRKRVEQRFSLQRMLDRYTEVYCQLLNRKTPGRYERRRTVSR